MVSKFNIIENMNDYNNKQSINEKQNNEKKK